jgi:hypothetical protein
VRSDWITVKTSQSCSTGSGRGTPRPPRRRQINPQPRLIWKSQKKKESQEFSQGGMFFTSNRFSRIMSKNGTSFTANLQHRNLKELPDELRLNESLKELDLSYNTFSKLSDEFLAKKTLTSLNFSYNRLRDTAQFNAFPDLVKLKIRGNSFDKFTTELTHLEELDCNLCNIKEMIAINTLLKCKIAFNSLVKYPFMENLT